MADGYLATIERVVFTPLALWRGVGGEALDARHLAIVEGSASLGTGQSGEVHAEGTDCCTGIELLQRTTLQGILSTSSLQVVGSTNLTNTRSTNLCTCAVGGQVQVTTLRNVGHNLNRSIRSVVQNNRIVSTQCLTDLLGEGNTIRAASSGSLIDRHAIGDGDCGR